MLGLFLCVGNTGYGVNSNALNTVSKYYVHR